MKRKIISVLLLIVFFISITTIPSKKEVENSVLPEDLPELNLSAGVNSIIKEEVIIETEVETEPIIKNIGYLTTNVNVRTEPNINSSVLEVYKFNQQIEYINYNEEWVEIKYEEDIAYIYKSYVSETVNTYREFYVPETSGFKSYEPYDRFNPKYNQYRLQQYAYTDENGLRIVDGRYCIALGTYFFENLTNNTIGTYVDLVLENGEVIQCILGDVKADEHTDANNIITMKNGCLSEFIVDKPNLPEKARIMGDISYVKSEWMSSVEKIIVYEKNFFYEEEK